MLPRTLTLLLIGLLCAAPARAESLYDPAAADLFTDLIARNVGDTLTVLINENTRAQREAKTETDKQAEYEGGFRIEGLLDTLFDWPIAEPLKALAIDPSEQFSADASTEAGGSFTGRLTVLVVEVLPNGNLVVEGRRNIMVNEEAETLLLRGIVRPTDIATNNSIVSSQIADADLSFTGKGTVSNKQHDGILSTIFNWIF